jgi:hypothetical protein
MGGGAVEAAVAVAVGVHIEATSEGARGVGGPLVEVAHHVEGAFIGDAAWVIACERQRVRELIQARVVNAGEDPGRGRSKILDRWVDGAFRLAHKQPQPGCR